MTELGEPPGAGADPVGDFGNDILAGRGPGRNADLSDTGVPGRSGVDEATVRTLENHLAQLEQRTKRLRRQKQTEIDELRRRLRAGERHLGELGERLEAVRAELAPARGVAADERTGLSEQPAPDEHEPGGSAAEALKAQLAALEVRAAQLERAVQAQRKARRHLESRLARAHARYAAIERTIVELRRTTVELRAGYEQLEAAHRAELERFGARVRELEEELRRTGAQRLRSGDPPTTAEPGAADAARRREMSEALAAAVERLRARTAEPGRQIEQAEFVAEEEFVGAEGSVGEQELLGEEWSLGREGRVPLEPADPGPPVPERPAPEPAASNDDAPEPAAPNAGAVTEGPAAAAVQASAAQAVSEPPPPALQARLPEQPAERAPWLAPAIRQVARRRDLKLAGELIVELLAAQKLILNKPLSYAIEIQGVGSFRARIDGERTAIERIDSTEEVKKGSVDFFVRGPAPAFSELAAGGTGRRLRGVKVQGKRRRLRRLLAARRPPLALADLAEAGIAVWPGLMLLALAEAIDPAWTKGRQFVIGFVVRDKQSATIYVSVRDGEPVVVTRAPDRDPAATVRCCERAFMSLLAGVEPPAGQQVAIEGSRAMLDLLISWTDRVQGLLPAETVS